MTPMTQRAKDITQAPLTPAAARQLLAEEAVRSRAARAEMDAATESAQEAARRARVEAELSKVEIAATLSIQRPTLDRWLMQ